MNIIHEMFIVGAPIPPSYRATILEHKRQYEEIADGKARAQLFGHPDWDNICMSCGDIEIRADEYICHTCSLVKIAKSAKFDANKIAEEMSRFGGDMLIS